MSELIQELRKGFNANAEEFDSLMVKMLASITELEAIKVGLVETLRQVMLTQESYADDEEVLAEIYLMVEEAIAKLEKKGGD